MTRPTRHPVQDKVTQATPSRSPDIESLTMTQEISTMSSSRFTFFPKRKFSSLKIRKRSKSNPKLTSKYPSAELVKCSLHDIAVGDPRTDELTDSTARGPSSKCCSSRQNSLLSCATCGNSPDTSPDTSTVQDIGPSYRKLGSDPPPDPLLPRPPPKIVIVPESIRKLSDYKFPRH